MAKPTRREFFRCPKCNALYQLVRGKAGPETTSGGETACQVCGELDDEILSSAPISEGAIGDDVDLIIEIEAKKKS